jgi:peptidyl-prolyl cis-trans isomerase D
MISWIQKYFQHHFRLIFAIMLIAMVVPLIWIFNASSGIGRTDRQVVERRVFGYNLASQEDQSRLIGDATLSAQMQAGYLPPGQDVENYALHRAATLDLANQLGIPASTKQEIAEYIKTTRLFAGQDGQFDPTRYAAFRDSLRGNPRMSEAAVSRVLGDDIRASKVQGLLMGPGYVLPSEVRTQLEQVDSSWTLGVATVDYASYQPSIPTPDAAIAKFYDENTFRYEIAPRVDVQFADFPVTNFLPAVTVTPEQVRAYYDANAARFPNPAADPKTAKRDPAADFAAVRAQVETTLRLERARSLATKAASDFSFALFDRKLVPGTPAFDTFLAAQKVVLKPLAPFTQEQGPAEFAGSRMIATEAFKLGPDRMFSDAVPAPAGAVVLFWKGLEPARKPALAEVRDKVTADYVEGEKRKRFVELGRAVRATIEARLKAGDAFAQAVAAAAAANHVKIDAKMLPAFSRRQPPQDLDYAVFGTLDRLDKGRVSDMVIAKDHGLIVYAADRKVPDLTPSNPQFNAARSQLAFGTGRVAASSYLDERVATVLKESEPVQK